MDLDRALKGRSGAATFVFAVAVLAVCTVGAATALFAILRSTAEVGITLGRGGPPHVDVCAASDVPLIAAAAAGDLDEARHLLDEGSEPNAADDGDNTALSCTVRTNDEDMILLLLAAGADPNSRGTNGDPVLFSALDRCSVSVAEQLLDVGADLEATDNAGRTPTHLALIYGDTPMLAVLADRGAARPDGQAIDPWRDGRDRALMYNCGLANTVHPARAVLNGLDAGEEPNTHLLRAIEMRLPWLVEEALDAGADPATQQSIRPGSPEALFNPNLPYYFWQLDRSDEERPAPPMPEGIGWDGEPLEMRGLEAGARIVTPALLVAAWSGDERVVRLLLDAGADPNTESTGGYTALHAAAANGCSDCTWMLLEAGAVAPEGIIGPEDLLERRQWASLALLAEFEEQWAPDSTGRWCSCPCARKRPGSVRRKHLYLTRDAGRAGDPLVPGDQHQVECFCQRHVRRVIRREVLAKLPTSPYEYVVRCTFDRELAEVLYSA